MNGLYKYGGKLFINPGESSFCDSVYTTCVDTKEFIWLDKETLDQPVESLSIITDYHSSLVTVAGALFNEGFEV